MFRALECCTQYPWVCEGNKWDSSDVFFFFFNDTAPTEIYPLSLHDALPISCDAMPRQCAERRSAIAGHDVERSEEHTSELQSRLHLVCRLLLEKKNKTSRGGDLCDVQGDRLP